MNRIFCSIFFIFLTGFFYPEDSPVMKYIRPMEITEYESGVEGIDLVYVINLDERPDKWSRMAKLLEEEGIHANRFSAINGWKLSPREKKEMTGPYKTGLKGGQIGCLLSHLSILKDAQLRNMNVIWILEDDAVFNEPPDQVSELINKVSKVDPEWDIIYTDSSLIGWLDPRPDQELPHKSSYYRKAKLVARDLRRIRQRHGTYSMLVSRKGIDKILYYYSHCYLWSAYDIDFHCIRRLREYSPTYDLVSTLRDCPLAESNTAGIEGLQLR